MGERLDRSPKRETGWTYWEEEDSREVSYVLWRRGLYRSVAAAHQIQRPAEPAPTVRDLSSGAKGPRERAYLCYVSTSQMGEGLVHRRRRGKVKAQFNFQVRTYMATQWPDQMRKHEDRKTEAEDKRGAELLGMACCMSESRLRLRLRDEEAQ